jgi:hypothetical protein
MAKNIPTDLRDRKHMTEIWHLVFTKQAQKDSKQLAAAGLKVIRNPAKKSFSNPTDI